MAATEVLSRFISSTSRDDLPEELYAHAKVAFLDWIAVTLAGKDDPLVDKLLWLAAEEGGNPQATVIGRGRRLSATQATLVNGSASHALDYDDTLRPFLGHPSVTLIPSLLALAEWRGASGAALLTAYLVGVEAGATIGACAGMPHYMAGWHATSTIGHLASAAGCAHLLGLDSEQSGHALGIAATQASGLKQVFGSMCKPFHAGRAAQVGLSAALLAGQGFTAASDTLEGPLGFFKVLQGQNDPAPLERLGRSWSVTQLAQKYHASCHATHSPIEATLGAMEAAGAAPGQVDSLHVHVSQLALDAAGRRQPATGTEGKFSIPYCVANAVLRGDTGTAAFTDTKVTDPDVAAFADRVALSLDADLDALEARVELTTNGGGSHQLRLDVLKQIPPLAVKRDKIRAKFTDLCAPVLGQAMTEDLERTVAHLEALPNVAEWIPGSGL